MKELINNMIERSGHTNESFALAVGTSPSYLSQRKNQSNINYQLLIKWARIVDLETIESKGYGYEIKITLK